MPLIKSVPSLWDISVCSVQEHLLAIGRKIIRKYGSYSDQLCKCNVRTTQEFLTSSAPPVVLDNILNTFTETQIRHDSEAWFVVLEVLMHPNMKVFWPEFATDVVPQFYEIKLTTMNQLVSLNLMHVCTDEILSVVGANCPALEKINIVSKVEEADFMDQTYFVSDKGLDSLHSCKKLKEILMQDSMLSHYGGRGRKITHEGIMRLLQHLPELQHIKYSDMGLVLENIPESSSVFNLIRLEDSHPLPAHIELFDRHCPKLEALSLSILDDESNDCHVDLIVEKLIGSRLVLSDLHLFDIPFDLNLQIYIQLNGQHLTKLSLSTFHVKDTGATELLLVAKYCPNLKELCLYDINHSKTQRLPRVPRLHPYFKNLISLHLKGAYWNPYFVLPLCLNNATDLRTLVIEHSKYGSSVSRCFLKILRSNPLVKLEVLRVNKKWNMSYDAFQIMILSCKSLKEVVVPYERDLVAVLKSQMRYTNFDIHFSTQYKF